MNRNRVDYNITDETHWQPRFPLLFMLQSKTIDRICVVKAGSAVLTQSTGELEFVVLERLCATLNAAYTKGWHPVLVTSGAVASGRGIFSLRASQYPPANGLETRARMFAAMGQASLLAAYNRLLEHESSKLRSAQVLLTKEAFANPERYKALCETLIEMLVCDILPIINTNDTVHVSALDFTDNDRLASYVAATLGADYLILLTDTDGVFSKNPKIYPDAKRIVTLPSVDTEWPEIEIDDTAMSAGGMQSKLNAMRLMADFGIPCCITNGKTPEGIVEILEGNESKIGTTLTVEGRRGISPVLKWMATGAEPEGTLIVSGLGAASIQRDDLHRGSILSIGVEAVLGDFPGGAIVAVRDESAKFLGVGRVRISADKLRHDLWKAEDKDVVRREHFLPLRQGRSFVDERTSLRRYVSNYAETYDFFVNKKNAYISMWRRSEPQGFRLELRGPAVNAVLARAERMTQELQIRRDDWLLYELASYYLQSAKATPKIDPPKA